MDQDYYNRPPEEPNDDYQNDGYRNDGYQNNGYQNNDSQNTYDNYGYNQYNQNQPYGQNQQHNQNQPYGQNPQYNRPMPPQANGMAITSLVLAICSFCCFLALPLGALSILFAILSKGKEPRMTGQAKAGVIISSISMVCSVIWFVGFMAFSISEYGGEEFRKALDMYDDFYYEEQEEYNPEDYGYDQDTIDRLFEEMLQEKLEQNNIA